MIDTRIQQQLRDRFNPEGSMLRKQQLRMLEILIYIDKVCKEHNIKYWLSSGTLLGAVRHGGFIPWDDDLDIEMLREDYEKFIKVFPNSDKYALQTNHTDQYYYYNFAKVRDLNSRIEEYERDKYYRYRGLFVDVFTLEYMPYSVCTFFGKIFGRIDYWAYNYCNKHPIWDIVKSLQKGAQVIFDICRPVFNKISKELHHSYGSSFLKARYLEDIIPLTEIQFEGKYFPAPKNYDHYLKVIFGEYEKLPDLRSITNHISECVIND